MIKINDLVKYLETIAPTSLQEDYDNAGLITGDKNWQITGVLVSLDCTEQIVQEAKNKKCNVIVAHHPSIFRGIKKLVGQTYTERTIIAAIKNDIAIYAIHTNLDNVYHGVNKKIADRLGLKDCKILLPKVNTLLKITTFIPTGHVEEVCNAMHAAGAGMIGDYKECSFRIDGVGTFMPGQNTQPYTGQKGKKSFENEVRVEMIMPFYLKNEVLKSLQKSHPYEEVAYYISVLENSNEWIGAGMIGQLENEMAITDFFDHLKQIMELKVIKHTPILKQSVKKIALCGGSGSFLIKNAINNQADIYITADLTYHQFFDADQKICLIDIGHYESEKYTIDLLFDLISNNFSTFALHLTEIDTNPVTYY